MVDFVVVFTLDWLGLKWRGGRMGDGQRKGVVEVRSDLVEEEPSYEGENKYKIQIEK